MKVYNISYNNNYHTNFGATMQLSGDKIPEQLSDQFKSTIEEIGDDKDVVIIFVGEKYVDKTSWYEDRQRATVSARCRNTYITSLINGKRKRKIITTSTDFNRKDDMKNLENGVLTYLKSLKNDKSKSL